MPANCKCPNGHTYTTRVIEDDPETNCTTVEDDICPECGSEEIEITEVYSDDFDDE